MELTLLGTGCPKVDHKRFGPSNLVSTKKSKILVDCGSGVTQRLEQVKVSLANIDALVLTHLHSDHVIDFYQLIISSWHSCRIKPWKIYGPKGAGILYVRHRKPFTPQQVGGGQERERRSGTEDVPGIVGTAMALSLAETERQAATDHCLSLRNILIDEISRNVPDSYLNGHVEKRLPNNVNFSFKGVEAEPILIGLDLSGIAASSGSACTSASLEPSHVLLAMGQDVQLARSSLRITLGRENTETEVRKFLETLPPLVQGLRKLPAMRL